MKVQIRHFNHLFVAALLCLSCIGESAHALDNDIYKIQQKLLEHGYSPGSVDGIMGANTKNAIKKFQIDSGLCATGIIDRATLDKLDLSEMPVPKIKPALPKKQLQADQVWLDMGKGLVKQVGKLRYTLGAGGFKNNDSGFVRVLVVKTDDTAQAFDLAKGKAYLVDDTTKKRKFKYIRDVNLSLSDKQICHIFGVDIEDQ